MRQLDVVAAWVRHATVPKGDELVAAINQMLDLAGFAAACGLRVRNLLQEVQVFDLFDEGDLGADSGDESVAGDGEVHISGTGAQVQEVVEAFAEADIAAGSQVRKCGAEVQPKIQQRSGKGFGGGGGQGFPAGGPFVPVVCVQRIFVVAAECNGNDIFIGDGVDNNEGEKNPEVIEDDDGDGRCEFVHTAEVDDNEGEENPEGLDSGDGDGKSELLQTAEFDDKEFEKKPEGLENGDDEVDDNEGEKNPEGPEIGDGDGKSGLWQTGEVDENEKNPEGLEIGDGQVDGNEGDENPEVLDNGDGDGKREILQTAESDVNEKNPEALEIGDGEVDDNGGEKNLEVLENGDGYGKSELLQTGEVDDNGGEKNPEGVENGDGDGKSFFVHTAEVDDNEGQAEAIGSTVEEVATEEGIFEGTQAAPDWTVWATQYIKGEMEYEVFRAKYRAHIGEERWLAREASRALEASRKAVQVAPRRGRRRG